MASALLQALKKRFPDLSSLSAITLSLLSIRKAKVPLSSFQSYFPAESLELLVQTTCPTANPKAHEKLVQAAKRIRKFSQIAEKSACSKCSLKGSCVFADQEAAGPPASVLDLAKVLYGLSQSQSLPEEQGKAAVEVAKSLDSALTQALLTPQSSFRVLKNVPVPQVIDAVGTPKQPGKPRKSLTESLKWKPSEQHLERQEKTWARSESRSTLNLIMRSIRLAAREDREKKQKTTKTSGRTKPVHS